MSLSTEEQIIVAVRRITQAVDIWSRELWKQCGLTSPQLAVLREVVHGANITPTSIAEALHLTQPTVTGILQRLHRAGLIRRERSQNDRRSVGAFVTPRGAAVVQKSPPLLRDRVQQRLGELSEIQRNSLLADLRLLAAILDAPEGESAPFLFSASSVADEGMTQRRQKGAVKTTVPNRVTSRGKLPKRRDSV